MVANYLRILRTPISSIRLKDIECKSAFYSELQAKPVISYEVKYNPILIYFG